VALRLRRDDGPYGGGGAGGGKINKRKWGKWRNYGMTEKNEKYLS